MEEWEKDTELVIIIAQKPNGELRKRLQEDADKLVRGRSFHV